MTPRHAAVLAVGLLGACCLLRAASGAVLDAVETAAWVVLVAFWLRPPDASDPKA